MARKHEPRDAQEPRSGKVENDHNKAGGQAPTQVNESQRTPHSRHDRESQIGSANQSQSRRGQANIGPGGRGRN